MGNIVLVVPEQKLKQRVNQKYTIERTANTKKPKVRKILHRKLKTD